MPPCPLKGCSRRPEPYFDDWDGSENNRKLVFLLFKITRIFRKIQDVLVSLESGCMKQVTRGTCCYHPAFRQYLVLNWCMSTLTFVDEESSWRGFLNFKRPKKESKNTAKNC